MIRHERRMPRLVNSQCTTPESRSAKEDRHSGPAAFPIPHFELTQTMSEMNPRPPEPDQNTTNRRNMISAYKEMNPTATILGTDTTPRHELFFKR